MSDSAVPIPSGFRPTLVDFFFLLVGGALSYILLLLSPSMQAPDSAASQPSVRRIGHIHFEMETEVEGKVPRLLILALPDLLRLHEGIVLLWPIFLGLQRFRGRPAGLTAGEWLWVFAWLGTAVVEGARLWQQSGTETEALHRYLNWPPVIWYFLILPAMALIALGVASLGLAKRQLYPWTHSLALALVLWPVLVLAGMIAVGKFG
jgi:hypothetical protein